LRKRNLDGITRIGIDEVSYEKGYKYLTLVTDLDGRRVIYATHGNDGKAISRFLTWLGPKRCRRIKVVVTDMHDPYLKVLRKRLPKAALVFDHFHGRLEVRECWATEGLDWLSSRKDWRGLRSVCLLRGQRTVRGQTSSEDRLYISSLPADAARLAQAIRGHWGIENSLHWVLDVAFREDESRKRKDNAPENLAVVRHIALNLLKSEKSLKRSIAGKRLAAGWEEGYLETVLSKAP